MILSGLLTLLFSQSVAWAAPVEIPFTEGDQILLRGVNAQITVQTVAGAVGPGSKLRITGLNEAGWSWERRDQVIAIDGPEGDSRRSLADQLKNPGARAVLEISGPSLPMEIHLRDGLVTLNRGQHEARVHMKSGRVVANSRTGTLRSSVLKGDVSVNDSNGRTDVDVYQGNINLKNCKGETDVALFGGALAVDQGSGTLSLNVSNATAKIQKFNGTLQVESRKGAVSGTGLQGRIEGTSAEGNFNFQVTGETDVNIKSQSGRVNVQLPPASGAMLNLMTGEGEIQVPSELKVARGALEKSVRGRVRGEGGKISVVVRSQEGTIVVK